MSWNHGTYGWEEYESFVSALKVMGIAYTEELKDEAYSRGSDWSGEHQQLRIAHFTCIPAKKRKPRRMVVEEYLRVKDCDCYGSSFVGVSVYEEGNRPRLVTQVLEA